MSNATKYEYLQMETEYLCTSPMSTSPQLETKSKVKRRYSGRFKPLKTSKSPTASEVSENNFVRNSHFENDFPRTRITRRLSTGYNINGSGWMQNEVNNNDKENLSTIKDKIKISGDERRFTRKSFSDFDQASGRNLSKIQKIDDLYNLPKQDATFKSVKNAKKRISDFISESENNSDNEYNRKVKKFEMSEKNSLSNEESKDLNIGSVKMSTRQRQSMNNLPVEYAEVDVDVNQLTQEKNKLLKRNNEVLSVSKQMSSSSENRNIKERRSRKIIKDNSTSKQCEEENQHDYISNNNLSNIQPIELCLKDLEASLTDFRIECGIGQIQQPIEMDNIDERNNEEKSKYTGIVKHYTDKTIKPFNKLETIFENSKGDNVMGKRKLKRYIDFAEVYSSKRKLKRKIKVRRNYPLFNLEIN